MIDVFKYLHNIYDTERSKLEAYQGRDTRGHSLKIAKPYCRLKVRRGFFSARVVSA